MRSCFNYSLFFAILLFFVSTCLSENVKKSISEDTGDTEEDGKDDMMAEMVPDPENVFNNCTSRREVRKVHGIFQAVLKQFPFMAAIFTKRNDYVCSGTIVANGLILTSANCLRCPVGYVLLNAISNKHDSNSVPVQIIKTETNMTRGIAILYTAKINVTLINSLKLNNYTNLQEITDFEAIGYGLNAQEGQVKGLQYVGLENRNSVGHSDVLTGFVDCVATKVPTCFRDIGGPAIADNELIGIITKGESQCEGEMYTTLALTKHMAEVLPTYTFKSWLDERIKKQERYQYIISMYPNKPELVERMLITSFSNKFTANKYCIFYLLILLLNI